MKDALERDMECHLLHGLSWAASLDHSNEASGMVLLIRASRKVIQNLLTQGYQPCASAYTRRRLLVYESNLLQSFAAHIVW